MEVPLHHQVQEHRNPSTPGWFGEIPYSFTKITRKKKKNTWKTYDYDLSTDHFFGSLVPSKAHCHDVYLKGGRILLRGLGVSLFTYIFSMSFKARLDPSGKLTNFQPPPPPRLSRGPSFSTVKFQPCVGRLRLYLWHFTSPATWRKKRITMFLSQFKVEDCLSSINHC